MPLETKSSRMNSGMMASRRAALPLPPSASGLIMTAMSGTIIETPTTSKAEPTSMSRNSTGRKRRCDGSKSLRAFFTVSIIARSYPSSPRTYPILG